MIERSVPEFGNPDIGHNVEFSLHPICASHEIEVAPLALPLTSAKIRAHLALLAELEVKSAQVISSNGVLRNAAVLAEAASGPIVANVNILEAFRCELTVCELVARPFAIFECKRVGVEEGMRKGPQTIEKAKQGVYDALLRQAIDDMPAVDLAGFMLTVGVVSNHGNWFTSDNHNKELRVLAQSYDWLLFLTDAGLSQFIDRLLLNPRPELAAARDAFLASYSGSAGANRFTKVRIALTADEALRSYFLAHEAEIESWFNVIAPRNDSLATLQADLRKLAAKGW